MEKLTVQNFPLNPIGLQTLLGVVGGGGRDEGRGAEGSVLIGYLRTLMYFCIPFVRPLRCNL